MQRIGPIALLWRWPCSAKCRDSGSRRILHQYSDALKTRNTAARQQSLQGAHRPVQSRRRRGERDGVMAATAVQRTVAKTEMGDLGRELGEGGGATVSWLEDELAKEPRRRPQGNNSYGTRDLSTSSSPWLVVRSVRSRLLHLGGHS